MRELQEQLEQAQVKVKVEQKAERMYLLEQQCAVEEVQRREEQKQAEAEAAKHAEAHAEVERRKQDVIQCIKVCNQCLQAKVTCEWSMEVKARVCDRCRKQHAMCVVNGKGVGLKKREWIEGGAETKLEAGPLHQQESGVQSPKTKSGGLAMLNDTLMLIA